MASQYKNILPAKYYKDHLAQDIRPDGRSLMKFRSALIDIAPINTADGSAIIKIGDTTVICGVKLELAKPRAEEPDKGFLLPNVDLPPLCSPKFKPGPPSDQAQVITQLIADILDNGQCIDLKELCIYPDRLAWILYCDVICLNHDGSVTDACVTAILAALKTVSIPEVQYDPEIDKTVVKENNRKPLNVKNIPTTCTFALFENLAIDSTIIIADPTSEEENLCTGIVTITVTNNSLTSILKPGGTPLSEEQIEECVEETKKRSITIDELLTTSLSTIKLTE